MIATVTLASKNKGELTHFLSRFYNSNFSLEDDRSWSKEYENPIELAEIIGTFIDNSEDYLLSMWICIDKGVFITITSDNADDVIRYLYERFPY